MVLLFIIYQHLLILVKKEENLFVCSGMKFFVLLDADGEVEHILPVCMNTDCSKSQIYVRDNNKVNKK